MAEVGLPEGASQGCGKALIRKPSGCSCWAREQLARSRQTPHQEWPLIVVTEHDALLVIREWPDGADHRLRGRPESKLGRLRGTPNHEPPALSSHAYSRQHPPLGAPPR